VHEHQDAAPEVVERVRTICLDLPEVYEERAWVGTRWCVRKKTFAHLATVVDGWPPAFARITGSDGPCTVLIFRSEGEELEMLQRAGPPFLDAGWGRDAVGLFLDDGTDWDEVAELLADSFCVMAPEKLAALVDRPPPPD
jgi:YjbR